MSATCFPQLMPILILLVKQVLLCPIPHVCAGLSLWPPLCRCHEPGLAQGQCNCPTIAAVLFRFNKGVMRNKEVSVCLWAMWGSLLPAWVQGSSHCWADRRVQSL